MSLNMAANLFLILALQLYVITDAFKSSKAALSTTSAGSVVEKSTEVTSTALVNVNFNDWLHWSTCTATCGVGNRVRTRVCNNLKLARGGTDCVGGATERQPCKVQDCPVNGNFSDWSIWSSCSLTCGLGFRIRERFCNNPKPAHGGTVCPGDTRQKRWCKERNCPGVYQHIACG